MDENQNIKSITVMIAGRNYPLKINEQEEMRIKKVAQEINQKINEFQIKYSSKMKQDWMAMALLTYANKLDRHNEQTTDTSALNELSSIESQIDQLLKS